MMTDDIEKVLLTEKQLAAKIEELGKQISDDYRDRDSDLKEYCPGDHWYDDIKYPCSYSKKDRNAAGRFNAAARSYLRTYLKQAESAKPCIESEKTALIRNYAEQLISQGGPAVDQVTRLFGDDFARRLILRHMYGADEQ